MNSRDTDEISDIAFIIALLLWTLWPVDFGVHMFQWGKDGGNHTAEATQKVCSNEWLALKEIEKISQDLEPEIFLENDDVCSMIF